MSPLLALRAPALLRAFGEAGVLEPADVHVATRLGRLVGEADEEVLLAAALAVRGTRQGSVVLRLDEVTSSVEGGAALPWPEPGRWAQALAASPLVGGEDGEVRPLRRSGDGYWLQRYWQEEVLVADELLHRAAAPVEVDPERLRAALARLWPGSDPDDQREAAAVCTLSRVGVLAGGPGTGKTTTVARLLAVLRALGDPARPPRVALAAPTGKAASRLQEAVTSARGAFDGDERAWLAGLEASTLHRLLGARRGAARPWYGPDRRLPHDVVVVDEASMVSLTLFARLLVALRPTARLLLVGDPDQLASVEAGAVLADVVDRERPLLRTAARQELLRAVLPHDAVAGEPAPATSGAAVRDGLAVLRTVHRYDEVGPIADLAAAVRSADADAVLEVLRRGHRAVRFSEVADDAPVTGPALVRLREDVLGQAAALVPAAVEGRAGDALRALDAHRLLCAHREGPRGVAPWSRTVQRWVAEGAGVGARVEARPDGRYVGLPLLVTANDPDNRLHNGDVGVVLAREAGLVAAFSRGPAVLEVPLGRLAEVRPLHAMTVHRSQGSQFAAVTVLLPPADSPLGTRETLYTAVTRAESRVHVIGSEAAVRRAVATPVARATGLRTRLG